MRLLVPGQGDRVSKALSAMQIKDEIKDNIAQHSSNIDVPIECRELNPQRSIVVLLAYSAFVWLLGAHIELPSLPSSSLLSIGTTSPVVV